MYSKDMPVMVSVKRGLPGRPWAGDIWSVLDSGKEVWFVVLFQYRRAPIFWKNKHEPEDVVFAIEVDYKKDNNTIRMNDDIPLFYGKEIERDWMASHGKYMGCISDEDMEDLIDILQTYAEDRVD